MASVYWHDRIFSPYSRFLPHGSLSRFRFGATAARALASMLTQDAPLHVQNVACDSIRADVFAACDGELCPTSVALIDAHLAICFACRERFMADAAFRFIVRRALSSSAAPQTLRDRVALLLRSRASEIAPA